MNNLFAKFISRMDKCGKLDEKVEGIDESIFEKMDLDLAEEVLVLKMSIKPMFLKC